MTRFALTLMTVSLTALTTTAGSAHATEVGAGRNFGLGFQIGDPTAIIGKAFIGRGNAIDFGLGFGGYGYNRCRREGGGYYDCNGYGHLSVHGDFLWQENLVRQNVKLDWHIGVGGRLLFWDDGSNRDSVGLVARMPVGLDLTFTRPSFLEVFFELAPGIEIVPGLWFDIDAALGVRFYF